MSGEVLGLDLVSVSALRASLRKDGIRGKGHLLNDGLLNDPINYGPLISSIELANGCALTDEWILQEGEIKAPLYFQSQRIRSKPELIKMFDSVSWKPNISSVNPRKISARLITLKNVSVVVGVQGFLLFRNKTILKQTAALPTFSPSSLGPPTELENGFLVLGNKKHSNIFHFLYDDCMRAFEAAENKLTSPDNLYFYDYSINYCKVIKDELFPGSKTLSPNVHYRFKELKFWENSFSGGASPVFGERPNYFDKLKSLKHAMSKSNNLSSCSLIYISRKDAISRRPMVNDDELERSLVALGFQSITMSDFTPGEQIGLFSSADIIVAQHGAALANLIFCKPETHIIELFPLNVGTPVYGRLAQFFNLNYIPFFGAHLDSSKPQAWCVDVCAVSEHISQLL